MTRQGVYLLVFDMHRLYQEMQEREQVELDDEGKHTCNELLSLLLWLQAVSMYVVFEREARELTFSCFHQSITCVTSIIYITHLYQKKITRTRNAQMPFECYEILNSRFALEHRYIPR